MKIKCLSVIIIATMLAQSCLTVERKHSFQSHRPLPYPPSDLIDSLVLTGPPEKYPGSGSDMHWFTWGSDDAIYLADDDGSNFGGPAWYAHILKITGIPPDHKVETVTDFRNIDFRALIPDKLLRRYINGIVSVDSVLYLSVYDYDWNIISKVYDKVDLMKRIKEFNPWHDLDSAVGTNMGFIDAYSKLAGVAGIISSDDGGKTWQNIPGPDTPMFLGPKFGGMSFITWGPGYSDIPDEYGDYVYGISNDGNWESGDNIFLARIHRDSILNRKSWQFFYGQDADGNPSWTKDEITSVPVFTDKGHVGHPTISFNKALGRYILVVFSDVVPHREDASPEEYRKWDYKTELQLYEAPSLYGPWRIFHNEMPWGGTDHTCYLGQIPGKWFSSDGLSGTIMFAGDYTHRKGEYYALMTQHFRITLKKK